MTLENSIKDVIAKKMEDGTVEKLIEEQLQKGVLNALDSLFGRYGDVTKVIEAQVKSVMVPYLENYDYSQYIVKLDSILVDVLKTSADENKTILKNFKDLMLLEERETIRVSELFETWCKYVAKEVDTNGLEVIIDDSPCYENVEVTLSVDYEDGRDWSSFDNATLYFECEHDKDLNFAIKLSRFKRSNKKDEWSISYDAMYDLKSLRRLNEFEVLLMRLNQAGTKLILDTDSECDDITPDKEPEATFS